MRLLTTGALCVFTLGAHANVLQYFSGISYNNPSQLFQIKNTEFILGGTGAYGDLKFTGSALNFNTLQYESGISHSRTYTLFPYGRIAKRVTPKFVVAVDVTEPFNSKLDWGSNTFTRYAATQNLLTDVDVSPKFSYSLSKNFHVGAGINFNFVTNNESNWAFPTGPTTYATLVNKSTNSAVGFNVGATYLINQTNFIDLTYYSKIRQNTKGTSELGPLISNNLLFSFTMPATTVLSYVHLFTPKWLLNLKIYQSEWDANQTVRFLNTAAPAPANHFSFSMDFDKAYAYVGALRNQYTEKLGLTLVGMVDDGPEQGHLRNLMFPTYIQYFVGIAGDYHVTAKTSLELLYGQVFSSPPMFNRVVVNNESIPFTTGNVRIRASVLDLKIKVQM